MMEQITGCRIDLYQERKHYLSKGLQFRHN